MKSELLQIFRRRYACHRFLPEQPPTEADLDFILEAGRLSPSSFGLEQWKFVVVRNAAEKLALQAACFDQTQVGSAGALIVILAKIADLAPDSTYVKHLLAREYPGEQLGFALDNYRNFHAGTDVAAWSVSQCHIAAANMLTAATATGLDSCAIGGFIPEQVAEVLGVDLARHRIALLLALGRCDEHAPEKQRLPLAELVEYR